MYGDPFLNNPQPVAHPNPTKSPEANKLQGIDEPYQAQVMTLFSTHILLGSILTYVCLSVSTKRYPFRDLVYPKIGHPGKKYLTTLSPAEHSPACMTNNLDLLNKKNVAYFVTNFLFAPHISGEWFQSHLGNNLFVEYNCKFWNKNCQPIFETTS